MRDKNIFFLFLYIVFLPTAYEIRENYYVYIMYIRYNTCKSNVYLIFSNALHS